MTDDLLIDMAIDGAEAETRLTRIGARNARRRQVGLPRAQAETMLARMALVALLEA